MGENDKAAAKPPLPAASAVFLVGSRGQMAKDDFLDQAATWVAAIVKQVGKGTVKAALGPPVAVASTIQQLSQQMVKDGHLADGVMDARLGSLRGHNLIFVTHGLTSDPDASIADKKATQGLLFHNDSTGRTATDIVLMRLHLDQMVIDAGDSVVAKPGLASGDPMTRQIIDFALVVDAIRKSVFGAIYLAACGGDARLEAFAVRLHALTNRTIFYNAENINLPNKPTPPYAEVGSVWPSDGRFHVLKGYPPYAPRVPANMIDLKSTTDTFLPGSDDRVP